MFGSIGPLEIALIVLIILLLFGAKKLPELGSGLGRGMREFKDGITGEKHDEDEKEALSATTTSTPPRESSRVHES